MLMHMEIIIISMIIGFQILNYHNIEIELLSYKVSQIWILILQTCANYHHLHENRQANIDNNDEK